MKSDSQSSCIAKSSVRNIIFLHQPHIRALNFTLQKSFLKSQSPLPPSLSSLPSKNTANSHCLLEGFTIPVQTLNNVLCDSHFQNPRISCSHHLHMIFSFQNPRVFMLSSCPCDILILESKGFHGSHHLSLEQNKKHHHKFCIPFL
jgi:hypothetical protein